MSINKSLNSFSFFFRLRENPSYSISDRYSDIIKTMWFVFMYATLIPLVTILFLMGMSLFYWIDKVNYFLRNKFKKLKISKHLLNFFFKFYEFLQKILV